MSFEAAVDQERRDLLDGLHELADWLAAHPNVPVNKYVLSIDVYNADKVQCIDTARAEGKADKVYSGDHFQLRHTFTGGVRFTVNAKRAEVCVAKVTGQETVTVPDYTSVPTKEVTRDVVEWECVPLLSPEKASA